MKIEIWVSIAALCVSIASTTIYFFQVQILKEQLELTKKQIVKVSDEVFKPKLEIISPFSDQEVLNPLKTVKGRISGNIPKNHVVIIGHRELAENGVAIRLDRLATVLPDNTFRADNIHLGTPDLGIKETFELWALIVDKAVFNGLDIGDGGKAFKELPPHDAETTILVNRIN